MSTLAWRAWTAWTPFALAAPAAIGLYARASEAAPVCPSGTFKTTEHHCDCPAGSTKNYHDAFKLNADCRAPAPPPAEPPTCPSGTFNTTQHHCLCPSGTQKNYHDVAKIDADCRTQSPPPPLPAPGACPGGTFNTTQHHCLCPAGTQKFYHDLFKTNADCHVPRPAPVCPTNVTFTTMTDNHCECPAGSARVYSDEPGSLHARCMSSESTPVKTNFDPKVQGFPFANPEECGVGGAAGCCTGMAWASLDLYRKHIAPPALSSLDADSKLAGWVHNATLWGVAEMAPQWALDWANQKADFIGISQSIDRGTPVPIGLFHPNDVNLQHSVVAYGYWIVDGSHRQILIYDVNAPKADCVLYNVTLKSGERWFEYCSDGSIPPVPSGPTCSAGQTKDCVDPNNNYYLGFFNEDSYFGTYYKTTGTP